MPINLPTDHSSIIYDTYELFRATHSHNSPQHSHIVGLTSHFYAHVVAGLKAFHPLTSKLAWM
ncbi:hypothetical protein RJD28_01035 [Oscillospiraceae bacterium NTUH-002-81]|nr:hypothetical protein RJD28_01035 [Oscillospiraceae bacterium NTUH-002-81]